MATTEFDAHTDDRSLRALTEYGVLDGRQRPELTALVALAAQVCGVPMASLNLITATEQHQAATVGFSGTVTPREHSMCAAVLEEGAAVLVPDASLDARFADNPFVTGEAHVRFYATHQLVTPNDIAIGTLCVFDTEPRQIDEEQADSLAVLASRVVDVLELDLRSRRLAHDVQRLERSARELTRSNTELAGFAAQVSHDLRGPLSTILSAHEMLEERLAGADDHGELWLLRRATDAALRMSGLVEGVLAYSSAGGRLVEAPVDLGVVVDQMRGDLADQLSEVLLSVGELPTVTGDEVQLRSVVQNLVGNAVKYADPDSPTRIEVTAAPVELGWRISVVDHGLGLPEDGADELFEPYRRGPVVGTRPGVGLGLSTCRKVIEAHGGRIGLEPTPGGGTTAWFELPG